MSWFSRRLLRADDDMEMNRVVKSNSDLPASAASRLGQRLRELRVNAPVPLTQRKLAQLLGASPSTVSMEEKGERLPSPARLTSYARLFSSPRSFAGEPRLLEKEDLTDEELETFNALEHELLELRREASTEGVSWESAAPERIWQFTDRAPITIVCADVPMEKDKRPSYWDPEDRNYVRAASFADLDALLDLSGHLRAENPATTVRIRAATEVDREEMGGHLVVLGGVAWNRHTRRLFSQLSLPVRQLPKRDDIFESIVTDGEPEEFAPVFDDTGAMVEDVGLFARGPNPQDPAGTLTICGGITTRGVRGAVLCFADPALHDLREKNQRYIVERFAGHEDYGFLLRVELLPGGDRQPSTPDLTRDETRLLEWSDGLVRAGSAGDR
jgi:transcriptional regulator with XRE-family HTH domain